MLAIDENGVESQCADELHHARRREVGIADGDRFAVRQASLELGPRWRGGRHLVHPTCLAISVWSALAPSIDWAAAQTRRHACPRSAETPQADATSIARAMSLVISPRAKPESNLLLRIYWVNLFSVALFLPVEALRKSISVCGSMTNRRSDERRGGKACSSTVKSRVGTDYEK